MSDVKEVIDKLGKHTPDEIAKIMRQEGVRGFPRHPGQCALAEYVKKHSDMGWVSVSPPDTAALPSAVVLDNNPDEETMVVVSNPQSVREFIFAFDEHQYPELEMST